MLQCFKSIFGIAVATIPAKINFGCDCSLYSILLKFVTKLPFLNLVISKTSSCCSDPEKIVVS